jgi:hypothetical protein
MTMTVTVQRWAAAVLAVAAVYVGLGLAWSLAIAAVLVAVTPMSKSSAVNFWTVIVTRARAVVAAVTGWADRRRVAASTMPLALVTLAVGSALAAGIGVGLVVAAVALGAVSLLTGWNA